VEAAVIVELPDTSTRDVSKTLLRLRHDVGAMAMGRVLTMLILTDDAGADRAVQAANDATREHPARILALVSADGGRDGLDAEIRVGGDAGASEIVVLRMRGGLADQPNAVATPLLLPDSPIVAWWPDACPPVSVAETPVGRMARRRITDADSAADPFGHLTLRARHYTPGDTDLAWTRITRWRGVLAASLEHPPYEPVESAEVAGADPSPSTDLMAGWLAHALEVRVSRSTDGAATGLASVRLNRASGPIELRLDRESTGTSGPNTLGTLSQPGQPDRRVPLLPPDVPTCLAAELRRLDADEVYADALTRGLPEVERG
jgi:glucose-6-phosphate dehydrogenase assembly protein OpcA